MSAQDQASRAIYHAIVHAAAENKDNPSGLLTLAQTYANVAYGPEGGNMRWDYHNTGARPDTAKMGFG